MNRISRSYRPLLLAFILLILVTSCRRHAAETPDLIQAAAPIDQTKNVNPSTKIGRPTLAPHSHDINDLAFVLPTQQAQAPTVPTTTPQITPSPTSEAARSAVTFQFGWGAQTHHFDHHREMAEMGMGWVKIQYKWHPHSQPRDVLDRIHQAHERGFKILLAIPGQPYPESIDYDAYVRFLAGVALLRPAPDAIEVWNEMNIDFEWPVGEIDPVRYVDSMLAPAYQAIKRNSPDTLVISGAPAPTGFDNGRNAWSDARYITGMAQAGAADYADCIGIHYNAGATSPHAKTGHPAGPFEGWYFLPSLAQYFNTFNGRLPLCITEIGYLTAEDLPDSQLPSNFRWAQETTIENQADWLTEAAVLAHQSGIVQLFIIFSADIYHWDGRDPQTGYAIFRPRGNCPVCEKLSTIHLPPTTKTLSNPSARPTPAASRSPTPQLNDPSAYTWLPQTADSRTNAQPLAQSIQGAIDPQAITADPRKEFVKIGFHVGPSGDTRGLGAWMQSLDDAGVPFMLKSVDSAGPLYEAQTLAQASGVPHTLVYRRSGGEFELPDYTLDPIQAAHEHWARHIAAFPAELDPTQIWMETVNEVDQQQAEWLGYFAAETARLALRDQRKWAAFGWSSGEPELVDWTSAGMVEFLHLASQHPDLIAVALHEYSYVTDSLSEGYPFLIGRFQQLFHVCDQLRLARPTVLITEFGWTYREVPPPAVAMAHMQAVSQLYSGYPEIKGAAIWYLGSGFGEIDQQTRLLLEPMTAFSTQTYYQLPAEPIYISSSLFAP